MKSFLRSLPGKPLRVRLGWLLLAAVLFGSAAALTYANRHVWLNRFRYLDLPAFDPHRQSFTCVHQADVAPPPDPEAQRWFEQGRALLGGDQDEAGKDYNSAIALWLKAAERKHWDAQGNLITLYMSGTGVQRDRERALQLLEEAMAWGEPRAWSLMAIFQDDGDDSGLGGGKPAFYAFLQKAADKGQPEALTLIGKKLFFPGDSDELEIWNNHKLGQQMLECALAQGHADAARQLGMAYVREETSAGNLRAMDYYQSGVKLGDEGAADALRSAFEHGPAPYVPALSADRQRSRRYQVFVDALHAFPTLRFPRLDDVLPLPPAALPHWDGNKDRLLAAAMAVGAKRPQAAPVAAARKEEPLSPEQQRLLEAAAGALLRQLNNDMNDASERVEQENARPHQ
jgi:TPR repeat protein